MDERQIDESNVGPASDNSGLRGISVEIRAINDHFVVSMVSADGTKSLSTKLTALDAIAEAARLFTLHVDLDVPVGQYVPRETLVAALRQYENMANWAEIQAEGGRYMTWVGPNNLQPWRIATKALPHAEE
jgi:hypothetical protein